MTRPIATAVVVTYNSADHIGACLSALAEADLDIRVVDNASTDRTVALITEHFPQVVLTANPVNTGFATAVNQGLSGADSDFVLLVNPDCTLPPDTARELVRVMLAQPEVGIAGPRLRDRNGQIAISAHLFESVKTVLTTYFGGSLLPVAVKRAFSGRSRRDTYDACTGPGRTVPVDWLSGACLALRTGLVNDIGGLDEGYFMYYEDEELCLQARRRGAIVAYVPTVEAVHIGGASSDPAVTRPYLYRSMLRFFARHRRRSFQLMRLIVLLRASIDIAAAGPLRGQPGRRYRYWREVCGIVLAAGQETAGPQTAGPEPIGHKQPRELRRS